ncbi:hypothetical protein Hanom_Chr06g00542171 [Helianthus anomalus]
MWCSNFQHININKHYIASSYYLCSLNINTIRNLPLQQDNPSTLDNLQIPIAQTLTPATYVSPPNNNNRVLPTRLKHNDSMSSRHFSNFLHIINHHPTTHKRINYQLPMCIISDPTHKVSRVRQHSTTHCLISPFSAG